ncbi:MAG: hypothetical protein GXP35_06160 [Actinobacteria bacterium]|nr:hypothetical protein [Actinomycetota bacterium]
MDLGPDRRPTLHGAKLRALTRDALGIQLDEVTGTADGALGWAVAGHESTAHRQTSDSAVAVSLIEQRPEAALGQLLAIMKRRTCTRGLVLCVTGAELVARRAELFDLDIEVWAIDGTSIARVSPTENPPMAPPPSEALGWIDVIESAGADVVVEHGVVSAEVSGLEVARVIVDEFGARLEVGISTDDRAMFSMLHGHMLPPDALAKVIGIVAKHRRVGAEHHPLNQLSRSRLLRSWLVADPERLGLSTLAPAPAPTPRANLNDAVPAAAVGIDHGGDEHVVVSSTGVDLELIPFAAHARSMLSKTAELIVVVPDRDVVAFTTWAAEQLTNPARVFGITNDWATGSRPLLHGDAH